uniref:Uncharacterized protein n=1 Tax=Arundo donax TaxID=35708 RepID=A0A0A9HZP9_ARUDO
MVRSNSPAPAYALITQISVTTLGLTLQLSISWNTTSASL